MSDMKCTHCKEGTFSAISPDFPTAAVCSNCHGLWFSKEKLEEASTQLEERSWFNVTLWEKKELLSAKPARMDCPSCATVMRDIDWKNGEFIATLCPSCGGMFIPKGEYAKFVRFMKDEADNEVLDSYGTLLTTEIEDALSGRSHPKEGSRLHSLLSFFGYRFMTKHPLLTEVIEELPFTK
jgi:Zn-finger nucleic acid-binding protein